MQASTYEKTHEDYQAHAKKDANGIPSQIAKRTMDNVASFIGTDLPVQLKKYPLAVLGIGFGVGFAVASVMLPSSRYFAMSAGKRNVNRLFKTYRKQIIKALGI